MHLPQKLRDLATLYYLWSIARKVLAGGMGSLASFLSSVPRWVDPIVIVLFIVLVEVGWRWAQPKIFPPSRKSRPPARPDHSVADKKTTKSPELVPLHVVDEAELRAELADSFRAELKDELEAEIRTQIEAEQPPPPAPEEKRIYSVKSHSELMALCKDKTTAQADAAVASEVGKWLHCNLYTIRDVETHEDRFDDGTSVTVFAFTPRDEGAILYFDKAYVEQFNTLGIGAMFFAIGKITSVSKNCVFLRKCEIIDLGIEPKNFMSQFSPSPTEPEPPSRPDPPSSTATA